MRRWNKASIAMLRLLVRGVVDADDRSHPDKRCSDPIREAGHGWRKMMGPSKHPGADRPSKGGSGITAVFQNIRKKCVNDRFSSRVRASARIGCLSSIVAGVCARPVAEILGRLPERDRIAPHDALPRPVYDANGQVTLPTTKPIVEQFVTASTPGPQSRKKDLPVEFTYAAYVAGTHGAEVAAPREGIHDGGEASARRGFSRAEYSLVGCRTAVAVLLGANNYGQSPAWGIDMAS